MSVYQGFLGNVLEVLHNCFVEMFACDKFLYPSVLGSASASNGINPSAITMKHIESV